MAVSEFKTHALAVLRRLQKNREPVTITSRGKPLAVIMPPELEASRAKPGQLAWALKSMGDLVSPACPAEEWEASR